MIIERLKDVVDSNLMLSRIIRRFYSVSILPLVKVRRRTKIQKQFDSLVKDISQLSQETGIQIWPAFGTLLGIYRENGPISHDLDVDFASWFEHRHVVRTLLLENGFGLVKVYSSPSIKEAYEEVFEWNGLKFDMFYFHRGPKSEYFHDFMRDGDSSRVETINRLGGLKVRRISVPIEGIQLRKYKDFYIFAPSNIEEHLSARYGDSFMTPDRKWSAQSTDSRTEVLSTDGEMNLR